MAFERGALMSVTPEFRTALVLMISVGPIAALFEETLISGTNPSVGPDTRCKIDGDLREFRPVRPRAFQFPFPRRPRRHSDGFRNLPDGRRPSLYFRAMRQSLAGHYAARDQQYRRRRVFNGHVI